MTSPACHWVRSVLSAYLDGELRPSTAEAVRRHLAQCESCRARLRLLQETWRVLDEAEAPPARAGFTARMMARLVEEKDLERLQARLRPHRRRRRLLSALSGLAAGLLVGFMLYGWTGRTPEPTGPVEREASRHLTFLEDADLLDEIAVIEAMDRLMVPGRADDGV